MNFGWCSTSSMRVFKLVAFMVLFLAYCCKICLLRVKIPAANSDSFGLHPLSKAFSRPNAWGTRYTAAPCLSSLPTASRVFCYVFPWTSVMPWCFPMNWSTPKTLCQIDVVGEQAHNCSCPYSTFRLCPERPVPELGAPFLSSGLAFVG